VSPRGHRNLVEQQRCEQGLPARISDPAALRLIARLLQADDRRIETRRGVVSTAVSEAASGLTPEAAEAQSPGSHPTAAPMTEGTPSGAPRGAA
jgi:hypothetical protein